MWLHFLGSTIRELKWLLTASGLYLVEWLLKDLTLDLLEEFTSRNNNRSRLDRQMSKQIVSEELLMTFTWHRRDSTLQVVMLIQRSPYYSF